MDKKEKGGVLCGMLILGVVVISFAWNIKSILIERAPQKSTVEHSLEVETESAEMQLENKPTKIEVKSEPATEMDITLIKVNENEDQVYVKEQVTAIRTDEEDNLDVTLLSNYIEEETLRKTN